MMEVLNEIAALPLPVIVTLTLPTYLAGVGTRDFVRGMRRLVYARGYGRRNSE